MNPHTAESLTRKAFVHCAAFDWAALMSLFSRKMGHGRGRS